MSWSLVTNEWRLKLLALGLGILMLGAVAFSQTRPTTKTLQVGLNYTVPPNIVLLDPPGKTSVTFSGLAEAVSRVDPAAGNLSAIADATRALPGSAVRLNVAARSTVPGITVQTPPPIVVNIDTMQPVDVPVQVNARAAPGWSIDPSKTLATCPGGQNPNPCKVHFVGPVSWENTLKAVVTVTDLAGSQNILNQPIQLSNSRGPIDFSTRIVPPATVDVTSADVRTVAVQGTTTSTVPLIDAPPTHGPPAGYRVTAITISPLVVTITGDAGVLQRTRSITLPAVDLSGSTSDATFQVAVVYPNGVSGPVANATLKYSISRNPNVSPSPSPP
jgi:hypothetical protein